MTTVYALTPETEKINWDALVQLVRQTPRAQHIVAIDYASKEFTDKLSTLDNVKIITAEGGAPPRMNRLVGQAVRQAKTKYVLTVESDVFVNEKIGSLLDYMERLPSNVAGIEGRYSAPSASKEKEGEGHPTSRPQWGAAVPGNGNLVEVRQNLTFSGTLWRREALLPINWSALPPLCRCDIHLSRKLSRAGYKLICAKDVVSMHISHVSRNQTKKQGDK